MRMLNNYTCKSLPLIFTHLDDTAKNGIVTCNLIAYGERHVGGPDCCSHVRRSSDLTPGLPPDQLPRPRESEGRWGIGRLAGGSVVYRASGWWLLNGTGGHHSRRITGGSLAQVRSTAHCDGVTRKRKGDR